MADKKQSTGLLILAVVLFGAAGVVGYRLWPRHPYDTISYPYVCHDCKAVYDVKELKAPGMWQEAPGASSTVRAGSKPQAE